ncbi:hypothetical protein BH11MYX4_BH11MYX4_13510 [soil metagenome]
MGSRRRLTTVALALALAATACSSCKRKTEGPKTEDAPPPDRLAPGEIVEGTEHAFGLPLPRASHVAARFQSSVDVTSTVTPEQLANFVRARVKEGKVTQGTSSTKLEDVIPRDDKNRRLTIEVRPLRAGNGNRSEMVVRDTTPPPGDPKLTEEERWKKAGMTPTGQLLDPKRVE